MSTVTETRTVEIDGEEHEVEVEVDPSEHGFLPKDEFKERLSEEVAKARQAEREKADGKYSLDEVATDEELLGELRDRNPDLFSENGDGDGERTLTEDDLDRFRDKWERENLKPVEERAEQLAEEARTLRVEKLDREVIEAASDLDFRDDPGVRRGLKLLVRDEMDYSEEDAEWYRTDGDGFEISTSEESESRYVTVREFLREMRDSGDYDSWLQSSTREGAGYGGTEGGGGGRPSKSIQDMSEQDRVEFIEENGLAAYNELLRQSFGAG